MAMTRLVMPQSQSSMAIRNITMVALGEEERMAAAVGIIVGAVAAVERIMLLGALTVAVGGD